ncbi:Gfo/Idh/MocA family protein [Porphyromonas sp.]
MKAIKRVATLLLATLFSLGTINAQGKTKGKHPKKSYLIETAIPKRPAGQKDVLGLRLAPMPVVRVGFIGLGMRGPGAVERFTHLEGVEIKAICDLHPERVEKSQAILKKAGLPEAATYTGSEEAWKELCDRPDIDLVYIATDWARHAPMMIYAMQKGKHVACEVPAVTSLQEAWDVVNTAERTQRHCMMLENCVYDFFELTTLNMAQQGLFGEVLSAKGAYIHNLEPFWKYYEGNWRLKFNQEHRGDVYATHGLGPACWVLNIHRGDRMEYLTSMDVPATSLPRFMKQKMGVENPVVKNGEMTQTLIKTALGKTIYIEHNVTSYRPYDRMYQVIGTDGFANKYPVEGYALRPTEQNLKAVPNHEDLKSHDFVSEATKTELMNKYQHPIQKEIAEKAKQVGGHGGMDFIMDYRLIYCLHNGLPLDMDVYDLAEWSTMGELTRLSLEHQSAPVAMPDFTRGAWKRIKGLQLHFAK